MLLRNRRNSRLRIAQEQPEFVPLTATESASSTGLDTMLRRAAGGTGTTATWFQGVLDQPSGKALLPEYGGAGALLAAVEESGHPGLVSLAIQLGFVGHGIQIQSLLKSLATTFADEFIA
jgi:hypothetical protein